MNLKYNHSPFFYKRRQTREVKVGDIGIGGKNPIRVQSMTTTDTRDTEGTVAQIIALERVGSEIVRLTVPSQLDAENLPNIRKRLKELGSKVPLVADIHFTPTVAMKAVEYVEKIRINPGNFADKKKFAILEYTDAEYDAELERIREIFSPLVLRAKELGVSMRIGTNHGSLSDRIMNRYGDTPQGMVESALEFIRIAEELSYRDIIVSMKASNPQIMIQAYRLLVSRFLELKMGYPLHLGVTEAGDGIDGRLKSAIGIGSLLEDGLGDTIRVSLTEDPTFEIPVANRIVEKFNRLWEQQRQESEKRNEIKPIQISETTPSQNTTQYREFRSPYAYSRFHSKRMEFPHLNLGENEPIRVFTSVKREHLPNLHAIHKTFEKNSIPLEFVSLETSNSLESSQNISELVAELEPYPFVFKSRIRSKTLIEHPKTFGKLKILSLDPFESSEPIRTSETSEQSSIFEVPEVLQKTLELFQKGTSFELEISEDHLEKIPRLLETIFPIRKQGFTFLFSLQATKENFLHSYRKLAFHLQSTEDSILLKSHYDTIENLSYEAAIGIGGLLVDGIGDAIELRCSDPLPSVETLQRLSYDLLQATRLRLSKTEYISCPSCGRTMFDLQETTARIKKSTAHLKGVKIAVMGCIVNGPGEMADADFGYVGAGVDKVHLYKGKEIVVKGVHWKEADAKLVDLIKENGMWVDP